MKKVVIAAMLIAYAAPIALAVDTVTLDTKGKQGGITFNHKKHSESLECKTCHGSGIPNKVELGKEKAHALCKSCHAEKKAGPVKCGECHTRKPSPDLSPRPQPRKTTIEEPSRNPYFPCIERKGHPPG